MKLFIDIHGRIRFLLIGLAFLLIPAYPMFLII
jgi:hypothetical protein